MTMYHDNLMDHFRHPRNFGCGACDANCSSRLHNPSCGDKISIKAKVTDGTVDTICFEGVGCALSTASASLLTEYVKGRRVSEVIQLQDDTILSLLEIEVNPARMKCATLPLEAVKEALQCVAPDHPSPMPVETHVQ